jgi:cation diffusion facilitator family transporter
MTIAEKHASKRFAAIASMIASGGLTIAKFAVGTLTGSLGIISEAIHSFVDFIATIITFFAVRFADMPADEDHHYGHEKIESLAALVETGLLFGTSAWIIYEAVMRIFGEPSHLEIAWYAFALVIGSIAVDFFRARNLLKVAKETKSQALEADALHFSSDMWSSFAVLVGLVGVSLGFVWADTLAALVVSLLVARAGYGLGKRSIEVLIDTAPPGVTEHIRALAAAVDGVSAVSDVRVRTFEGVTLAVEIRVVLPADRTLGEVVRIKGLIAESVRREYADARVVVSADAFAA